MPMPQVTMAGTECGATCLGSTGAKEDSGLPICLRRLRESCPQTGIRVGQKLAAEREVPFAQEFVQQGPFEV